MIWVNLDASAFVFVDEAEHCVGGLVICRPLPFPRKVAGRMPNSAIRGVAGLPRRLSPSHGGGEGDKAKTPAGGFTLRWFDRLQDLAGEQVGYAQRRCSLVVDADLQDGQRAVACCICSGEGGLAIKSSMNRWLSTAGQPSINYFAGFCAGEANKINKALNQRRFSSVFLTKIRSCVCAISDSRNFSGH